MIHIIQALYINGSERKLILSEDLSKSDYEEIYKGKIFCPIEGCNAEFGHREVQKRGYSSYFYTLPSSTHKDNCPNKVNKSGKRTRKISIDGVGGVELNEEHARNVLRDAFKVATGKKKKGSGSGTKKGSSPTTKDDGGITTEIKTTVSGGGKIGKSINEKQPYIYKKSVSDFLISPIDTYCVYGEVVSVKIGEDEGIITIKDSKNKMSIYIGNPFKINFPQEFRLLKALKLYLDSCGDSPVICACICISKNMNGKMAGELMDYRNISMNNLGLMAIVNFLNGR